MNYYSSAFPVLTSSKGIAYEIYLAGCEGYCEGCHSKHTWDFNAGKPMEEVWPRLRDSLLENRELFDNVVIMGGEPLDHGHELELFLQELDKLLPDKDIYVYTHFGPVMVNKKFPWLKELVDYLKLGDYDPYLPPGKPDPLTGVTLATGNQYFIKGDRASRGRDKETEVAYEVKKNIEWLEEKIGALPCADTIFNSCGSRYIDSAVSIMAVYDLIDQLDEPETLTGKVQLSQKMADDLNRYKERGYSLQGFLVKADSKQAQEKLARAWLYGYTVEEEQKYNVSFKLKSSFGTVGIFLYKEGDEVLAGDNFKAYCPKEEECRLTEQEIRGFQNGDILFEHFAVKAEELEE